MNLPNYPLTAEPSYLVFRFESQGKKGNIGKLIRFTPTSHKGVHNLSFGDADELSDELNDHAVSGNGDPALVLATVATAVYAFSQEHPGCWIFMTGSTPARTRLYRMAISKFADELKLDYHLLGVRLDNGWEDFQLGVDYEGFAVQRKLDIH